MSAELILPSRGAELDAPPVSPRAWRSVVITLHLCFVLVVGLAAWIVAIEQPVEPWSRPVAYAALGVLALAYGGWGWLALDREADGRTVGYLVVLAIVVTVLGRAAPDTLFIFFVGYAQVWFLVGRLRPGIVWTLVLFAGSTAGVVGYALDTHGDIADAIGSQAIGVLFSLLVGIWCVLLIDKGRVQATLIKDLERAQAQLAEAHHSRGVLAERERMAREVHDTLAQGYTSIVMLAQTALADSPPAPVADRLMMIEEVARANLGEARALVAALAPPDLDGRTISAALARVADRFRRETGLAVAVELDADTSGLRPDEEVVLVRSAQEALSNVRRHASASRVTVRLTRLDGALALQVADDGIGFATRSATGSGLVGLRSRLEQVGGSLSVQSAPGDGTRFTATVSA